MRLRESCESTVSVLDERLRGLRASVDDIYESQVKTLDLTLRDWGDSADDEDREIVERLKVCLDKTCEALYDAADAVERL